MSSSVVSNTCRITVISSEFRADLAVPVHIPVAELLATLVSSLGRQVADEGAANGGWILQRAAEPALDPAVTLAASQIRDGDILHLRSRATQLPEIAFDDVLDAVATGVLTRTARWRAPDTASSSVALGAALLIIALVTTLASGPKWVAPATTGGVAGALLLAAAIALARAYHQRGAALVAASAAIAFGAASGAMAVGGHERLVAFGAAQLLLGACAALFVAVILILTLGSGVSGLTAVISLSLLAAIGTGVDTGTSLGPDGTSALVAAIGLAVSPMLPMLAFRLSRLPLPTIPSDAADLRRDEGTVDAVQILRQATLADQFLGGLLGGVALATAGSAVLLAAGGMSARILAGVLGVICLLRGRLFAGRAQRIWLLAAGAVALAAVLVFRAAALASHARILAIAAPAVVLAVILLALAVVLPGRRYSPPWSRTADIIESLLVLSVIPLALAVMGVYGAVRTAVK
ncbi:MAG: type VII secretion integral membrane protein EccD [Jatrophihabitantaceae bacterium]